MGDIYRVDSFNLYQILKDEIDEKGSNWTSKEITDYIYIRLCQIFNYDERWSCTLDDDFRNEIYDKEIDIFNVDTKKVVCSSFSKMFEMLVNVLLMGRDDFDMALTEGDINTGHMNTICYYSDGSSKGYDPILSYNDFLNAKKGLPIEGITYSETLSMWKRELRYEEAMYKIGYKNTYEDFLRRLKDITDRELEANDLVYFLLSITDIEGLGMAEVNKLLNIECKEMYGRGLKSFGVQLKSEEDNKRIRFHYMIDGISRYEEEETEKGVVFTNFK